MALCYGMKDGKLQTYVKKDLEEDLEEELEEEDEEEGIPISEKHGLNPTLDTCMICGEAFQILLLGKLPNDEEAPKQICTGQVCPKCIDKFKENNERIYIEYSDNNLTGRYAILPDKVLVSEYLANIGEKRVFYLESNIFNNIFNEQGRNSEDN